MDNIKSNFENLFKHRPLLKLCYSVFIIALSIVGLCSIVFCGFIVVVIKPITVFIIVPVGSVICTLLIKYLIYIYHWNKWRFFS